MPFTRPWDRLFLKLSCPQKLLYNSRLEFDREFKNIIDRFIHGEAGNYNQTLLFLLVVTSYNFFELWSFSGSTFFDGRSRTSSKFWQSCAIGFERDPINIDIIINVINWTHSHVFDDLYHGEPHTLCVLKYYYSAKNTHLGHVHTLKIPLKKGQLMS